eukprot:Skav220487  [mRNA]  locus=scaffold591:161063:161932:+ [translate_table: standard]
MGGRLGTGPAQPLQPGHLGVPSNATLKRETTGYPCGEADVTSALLGVWRNLRTLDQILDQHLLPCAFRKPSAAAMGQDCVDRDSLFSNYKSIFSRQFAVSLLVEFIGVMFFQIIGASAKKGFEAWVNAMALAVWIYTAANISGGHLNPAVTASMAVCGFFPVLHSVVYVILQVVGAIVGAWITSGLIPGAELGSGSGPGCFDRSVIPHGITDEQAGSHF